ncbi:MAG: ATP-binding protein [Bacteroidales bacterium]|nr:ATP-binding protein [Bacteroidales bacterium]
MITAELKLRIVETIKERLPLYGSANKMSVALGINNAQLSRVMKGEIDNVISDANWVSIARKLDVQLHKEAAWVTAKTPVYMFIHTQLETCQKFSLSGLLCDIADIGKTHTAKEYVRTAKHAIYIDCAQVKSKQKLIKQIAKELGLGHTAKYNDVYGDLVFYLRSIPTPLIILDEAGDLDYPAFLELKALWNATEGCCGWFMMGADGLKRKIESNLANKKVGYAEILSRFGSVYQKITPDGKEALNEFIYTQIALISTANNESDVKTMIAKTNGSLRRLKSTILKPKTI